MIFAKLKQKIDDSREDGFLARISQKISGDCESCPCSWEDRSCEGECGDCGCHIYGDLSPGRMKCFLPDFILRAVARRKENERSDAEMRAYDGIADWYETARKKDAMFRQAIEDAVYADRDRKPVKPYRRTRNNVYMPYETQDGYALARMDYESNLESGMPRIKAFQRAVAERLDTDLYYPDGRGGYGQIMFFARSGDAVERYHELLRDAGIEC